VYYTINIFEIKEMFGDYQTFLRAGGAAVILEVTAPEK